MNNKNKLFISGIFHLIFLASSWPQVTETTQKENCVDEKELPYHGWV
jgi:hypothetical protein